MERLKDLGSGTREAWKGVGASVLLHLATAAVALYTISAVPPTRTPLVVDLTIGGPWDAGAPADPAPAWKPRRAAIAGRPDSPTPAIPVPAATPDRLPSPPKGTTPVAATPASKDRQAETIAPPPSGSAGGTGRTPPPGSGAVSDVPTPTAPAIAGVPQGAIPGAPADRAATGIGAGAGEFADTRAKARGRYLERSYAYIRDAIQQGIAYPAMARKMGWEGRVVVAFLVLSDGSVRDVRVVHGSGHPALDRGAVEAVRNAAPFPRPPAEAEIITPVVYRLE
ncbi:MAG TPA: energy transducer TonB [Candidatus Deferrimicrobiaceae bacterium]